MDALAFIEKQGKVRRQPFYVLSGDEDFLKRHVLAQLVPVVIGDAEAEYAVTNFEGAKTEFSSVRNELDSVSFFSDRRLVIVDQADPFVTKFRTQLEQYVTQPSEVGTLVLDIKSFPATTKLYKAVPEASHIVCKAPSDHKMAAWCVSWCQLHHGKKLTTSAAQLLYELVGSAMGVLDQEMQKLKDFVGERATIEPKDVDELTGRSKGANVFQILDAAAAGMPEVALKVLTDLFDEGEQPLAILGALGFQLRKIARAARMMKQGMNRDEALTQAGVPSWPQARDGAFKQMQHFGWNRIDHIYDWLLEIDSGVKGGNPLPEPMQVERLVVRLARPRS